MNIDFNIIEKILDEDCIMVDSVNHDVPSRPYHADVRSQLARHQAGLPRYNMTVHVNSFPQSIYNEVKGFANKDGSFGRLNEIKYNKALLAQKIADANQDKKIEGDEVEIYDAISELYGNPEIGGVTFTADDLANVKSIAKDADGMYNVEYAKNDKNYQVTYAPFDSGNKVQFSSIFNSSNLNGGYQIAKAH